MRCGLDGLPKSITDQRMSKRTNPKHWTSESTVDLRKDLLEIARHQLPVSTRSHCLFESCQNQNKLLELWVKNQQKTADQKRWPSVQEL